MRYDHWWKWRGKEDGKVCCRCGAKESQFEDLDLEYDNPYRKHCPWWSKKYMSQMNLIKELMNKYIKEYANEKKSLEGINGDIEN